MKVTGIFYNISDTKLVYYDTTILWVTPLLGMHAMVYFIAKTFYFIANLQLYCRKIEK